MIELIKEAFLKPRYLRNGIDDLILSIIAIVIVITIYFIIAKYLIK